MSILNDIFLSLYVAPLGLRTTPLKNFILLSFGGAGGLHAADLARGMGIPQVLVPPMASTLSAFGMLVADIVKDYSQTVMLPGTTSFADLQERFAPWIRCLAR